MTRPGAKKSIKSPPRWCGLQLVWPVYGVTPVQKQNSVLKEQESKEKPPCKGPKMCLVVTRRHTPAQSTPNFLCLTIPGIGSGSTKGRTSHAFVFGRRSPVCWSHEAANSPAAAVVVPVSQIHAALPSVSRRAVGRWQQQRWFGLLGLKSVRCAVQGPRSDLSALAFARTVVEQ